MREGVFVKGRAQAKSAEAAQRILAGLNDTQQQAVKATDGPVLIVAGPGSGKTRTLTMRVAYLLATGKARAHEVLALTFTNKAAREIKERVARLVGADVASGMWLGTFHSVLARMLRSHGKALGYTSDFSIYDTDDSERMLRELMDHLQIDRKQYLPRQMRAMISSAKNNLVRPEEYEQIAQGPYQERAAALYGPYQKALLRANALDFDDLLIKPLDLFRKEPDTLARYQRQWTYLHIDEYQDTNQVQYRLAKQLAGKHQNICVVGDDAQSIYAFRGADITNILSFQSDYPDATVVRLEQNYRSTKTILKCAASIIRQNKNQLKKDLWTQNGEGAPVVLVEALSEKDEAQRVSRLIRDHRAREGYDYKEFAVLYRTNHQSRSFEDAMRAEDIPYRVVGGMSFYQRKEIRDALAYLRLVVNPYDGASLRRVINYPTRGIGHRSLERLTDYARRNDITPWQAMDYLQEAGLPARARNAVNAFRAIIETAIEESQQDDPGIVARRLLTSAGLFRDLEKDNTPQGLVRSENVKELISAIAEHAIEQGEDASLSKFLQDVALVTDADEKEQSSDYITLMTLHASKGLEFRVVCIGGMEEELFPHSRAAREPSELEEERRLFYVGATRAKSQLYLCNAVSRFRFGSTGSSIPSRFLSEIDASILRKLGNRSRQRHARRPSWTRDAFGATSRDTDGLSAPDRKPNKTQNTRSIVYDEEFSEIVPGIQVEHDTFGTGKVLSRDGQGRQATATVFFHGVGQKKLRLTFARLRRVE